jgi:outer membrane protein insertion porin family
VTRFYNIINQIGLDCFHSFFKIIPLRLRRILLILPLTFILLLMGRTEWVYAKETPKVAILPFTIHGPKELNYLVQEIPKVLGQYLQQEGALMVSPPAEFNLKSNQYSRDNASLRLLGQKIGVDFIIYGSLTRITNRFSLDATLINVAAKEPPIVHYVEGEGIENLLGTVKNLADKIKKNLFQQQLIAQVRINGTKRIEPDAIRRIIKTKPGDYFSSKALSDDLRAIYQMGYFEDIKVESADSPKGKVISFNVVEKPTIRRIIINGNKVLDDEKIQENLNISTGSILNVFRINSNIKAIENLYKEKNYQQVKVTYKVDPLANNQADLIINIEEGQKIRIKSIRFEGNSAYDSKRLKKIMKTSEKGFFSWLTSSGDLNREDLDQDISKISDFYQNNGYIQAKVSDPIIEYKDIWIYITIKIEEGPRFKVGKVDVAGDLIFPKKQLLKELKIRDEAFYNQQVVRNDLLRLTEMYSNEGYANAQIFPKIDEDSKNLIVNITYTIDKYKQVYFERINISGNTITRDKVIRRQLKSTEGELFSGKDLKFGIQNLYRLEYFEDIKVDTARGSADNKMDLDIDVTEKSTGQFSFGAGFSSIENLFIMSSISENNLFGRGQILQLSGQLGAVTNTYTLSFTEPWLFDIPLRAGAEVYQQEKKYRKNDELAYVKDSTGFRIKGSYPILNYTRAGLIYNYDNSDISIKREDEVPDGTLELRGRNITNSITAILSYDTRDRSFNATKGSHHIFSVEYAGFGGDIAFTKYLGETSWYVPLFLSTVGSLHGETGYVEQNPNGILPDYERFFLGGDTSLRGFGWGDVGPREINSQGKDVPKGGNKYIQFNFEYLIPVAEKAGIWAFPFYDTGNAWKEGDPIELSNLRESAGLGIKWLSPLGPIQLAYGWVLDPKPTDNKNGGFLFYIGAPF